MKILMISTDFNILKPGSEARERMIGYGAALEELHIIIRNQRSDVGNQKFNNVYVYPTQSNFKILSLLNAYKLSKKIIQDSRFKMQDSIITAQDPFENGLIGYCLKKKFGLPLELQVHTDFLSPYFGSESLKNRLRVRLAKFLLKKADTIRVVSERIKNSLLDSRFRLQESRISVRPVFVDAEKIRKAPIKTDLHKKYPDHDFIILMASRLTAEKNIALAIQAINDIASRYRKVLLLIVGDGPESETLKLKCRELDLGRCVRFEPWTDDLVSYYKTADLFLLTSNYEGYGRTVIEAMAAGLPVIMTDVGIAREVLGNQKNGTIVPIGDVQELTDALTIFISGVIHNRIR